MNDVAAQAFIFFVAGFETSSATMAFCLYELATNPSIQRRLQKEIDVELAKCGGVVTYEAMQEMEYLDKVLAGISHTLYFTISMSYCSFQLELSNLSTSSKQFQNWVLKLDWVLGNLIK